jgi:YggT family protein
MGYILKQVVDFAVLVLDCLIIAHVFLPYIVSSSHPLRVAVDRIVLPLLNPIRRVVPVIGMIDISPMILIILVQLIAWLLNVLIITLLR